MSGGAGSSGGGDGAVEGAALLVLEDDADFALVLAEELRRAIPRLRVIAEHRLESALEVLESTWVDAAVIDRTLPDGDGLDVVRRLRARGRDLPFILLTGDASAASAVECLREGAREYIVKGEGAVATARHVLTGLLAADPRAESPLVGRSAAMGRVRAEVRLYASSDACVLIEGETGVGKELVARALHDEGPRSSAPFVAVNCGALPEHLVESELFGHVRGAFTGAHRDHPGLVELAARGTLFLDEIEDLPLALQGKMLRLLQEGEYRPVGGARAKRAELRVIAACNADLRGMVEERRFRRDLFFRLNVLRIAVPPLRARVEDLPALLAHLAERSARDRTASRYAAPSAEQLAFLARHRWSGNVRELANLVECAAVHAAPAGWAQGWAAALARLDADSRRDASLPSDPDLEVDPVSLGERRALEDLLARHRWRREAAARELGVSRVTLWRRMRRAGLAC
jgi:two-component system, NtrC family, nitrogen regulation response regulator GlnG